MTTPTVIFYGVIAGKDAGHLMFGVNGMATDSEIERLPLSLRSPVKIDCVWTRQSPRSREEAVAYALGRDPQEEGEAYIHLVDGWTVIAWWDRSGDDRRSSSATFLVEGKHRFSEALCLAEARFPREISRMQARYMISLRGKDLEVGTVEEQVADFMREFGKLSPDVASAVLLAVRGIANADAPKECDGEASCGRPRAKNFGYLGWGQCETECRLPVRSR